MQHKTYLNQRTAVASVAYLFSDVMEFGSSAFADAKAEVQSKAAMDEGNLFGQKTKVFDCEKSENTLGLMFGAMQGGAVASGFVKDAGMLNVEKLVDRFSARNLPAVLYLATNDANVCEYALNTDVALAFPSNAQEAADLAILAHLTIGKSYKPFVLCLDDSKEAGRKEELLLPDKAEINQLFDVVAFCGTRARGLARGISCDIEVPILLEAELSEIVAHYLEQIAQKLGRNYQPVAYAGAPDAEYIFVSFGPRTPAIEEAVCALAAAGQKVGLVKLKILSPLHEELFRKAFPPTAKKVMLVGQGAASCSGSTVFQRLAAAAPALTWVPDAYALGTQACSAEYVQKACAAFTAAVQKSDNKYWTGSMDSLHYAQDVKPVLDLGENRWVVANSLSAQNVDFGLGMVAAWEQRRDWILNEVLFLADNTVIPSVSQRGYAYLDVKDDTARCGAALQALLDDHVGDDTHCSTCTNIRASLELLHKKYFWVFAGDGRMAALNREAIANALSSGENINLFAIQDRAVYKKAAEHTFAEDIFFGCNQAKGVCAKTITLDMPPAQIENLLHQAELHEGPSIVVLFA